MVDQAQQPVVTIAVSSGKGGVGKTNTSVNLATALGACGRRVLLMDADLGMANIDVLLGCRVSRTLEHVVSGETRLADIVVDGPPGVKFIPAASGVSGMAELSAFAQSNLIQEFGQIGLNPEFLVIDVAAGVNTSVINFCSAAQHVLVVACDEPTSLTDAYGLIKVLSSRGVRKFQLLANMVKNEQAGYGLYQKLLRATDRFLDVGLGYAGMVPMDENLRRAVARQQPVTLAFPRSASARAYRQLAVKMAGLSSPDFASGRLEFYMEQVVNRERQTGTV